MALTITSVPKTITFERNGKTIELDYPNQDMTPEEVIKHHSGMYPALNNAKLEGPVMKNNQAQYKATTKAGKLG